MSARPDREIADDSDFWLDEDAPDVEEFWEDPPFTLDDHKEFCWDDTSEDE